MDGGRWSGIMPEMCVHRRRSAVLSILLAWAFAFPACQKRGAAPGLAHPALTPADTNRARLVGRVLVPSLDRTSRTVDELRTQGALPFSSSELRQLLLARLSLPEEVLNLVDTARPIAVAFVAGAAGAQPLAAGALALRGQQGAGAFFEALGTLVGNDRDVLQVRRRDGEPVWVLHAGQALAWAESREALVEAGAHALEARTEAADDLAVVAYPAAWARSQGLDLGAGHEPLKRWLLETVLAPGARPRAAAERASLEAVLDFVLKPIPETDALDVRLGLSRERGAAVSVRAFPRAGSAFAARTVAPKPYALEAALLPPRPPAKTVALVEVGDDPTPSSSSCSA